MAARAAPAPFDPEGLEPSTESKRFAAVTRRTIRPLIASAPPTRVGIVMARLLVEAITRPFGPPSSVRVEQVQAEFEGHRFKGEWVRARGVERDEAALLYLHGSGYVSCSPVTHRGMVARLSALSGVPAFTLDYRLAPEHVFPCAAEDTMAAYRWLLDQGYDPERIVVGGDSAGGHLAIGLAVDLVREGLPVPAGLLLISPLVDHSFELSAQRDRDIPDPLFSNALGKRFVAAYAGAADQEDHRLTLMRCDATKLPPMLIQSGGLEMLTADAEAFAEVARAAGVDCELQVWPGQVHVFQIFQGLIPEARPALEHAGAFISRAIGAGERPAQRAAG
jgi:monoterpene epsilon-lactone hydrolase